MLSGRGKKLVGEPSPLVVSHFKCVDDKFHPETNPGGYINFGTAENHLMDREMTERLNQPIHYQSEVLHYGQMHGTKALQKGIAGLMEQEFGISKVISENIVVASGASAVLEAIAMSLFEDGEGLIVPAPFYTGFSHDFSTRFNVKIIPYHLKSENNYMPDPDELIGVIKKAKKDGITVKAILICSPHNPLGIVYSDEVMQAVISVAETFKLEIIADEIYAGSVYHGQFKSLLELGKSYRQHIHFAYGFAKDFVLSGFKTGVFYTENKALLTAVQEITYFHAVSTYTQKFLELLVFDLTWCRHFISTSQSRLRSSYLLIKNNLADKLEVQIIESTAGIFIWADFSRYLKKKDFESELRLFREIFDHCKVVISPGQYFESIEPGWFRICFAQEKENIEVAIKRLEEFLL